MMKPILAIFFVILFILQGLFFLKDPQNDVLVTEKRTVTQFPKNMRVTARGIRNYFAAVDLYFADRLLFRSGIMELTSKINYVLNDTPNFDKAFRGLEGWLFLGNDYSQITDKVTGREPPRSTTDMVELIKRGLSKYPNIPKYFILGSVKSSVYPEYLPELVKPAQRRYVQPLLENMSQAGLKVLDPTNSLKANKSKGLLYFRTDTHWNLLGGMVAATSFLDFYNSSQPDREPLVFPENRLVLTDIVKNGDLIFIGNFNFFPKTPGDVYKLIWSEPRPNLSLVDKNGHSREIPADGPHGMLVSSERLFTVINSAALTDLRVWFFCDSFSESLSPYFHAIFAETKYISNSDLFMESGAYSEGPLPDFIIFEIVERDL